MSFEYRLPQEIELLLELQVCFKLESEEAQRSEYIFPCLGTQSTIILLMIQH